MALESEKVLVPRELVKENKRLLAELDRLREDNKQLLREFERDRVRDKQQMENLRLMFEVAARVASTLDLKQLLPKIMQGATRVLNAEASSLMLVDEETGDLFFEVALGEKGEQVKTIRLKRGKGIAGWVLQHGKTLLVPDVDQDPRHAKEVPGAVGFLVKSILCSPLRQVDKIIGVVQVLNKLGPGGPAFSEEDIPLFEAFADQAATAISQARAHQDLADLFNSTVRAFSATLDARDPYTHGHSERVTDFSVAIAEEIVLSEEDLHDLRLSALLHDVGKVGVPDAILLKSGKLSGEEFELMKQHPVIGYHIVKPVKQLKRSLDGIRYHHERIDGRGYPDGLKGDQIPLQGRIIAVADCFDAMTSTRSYRERFATNLAVDILIETKGTQHDPRLVDAFVAAYEKGKIIEQARRPQPAAALGLASSL
jgi:HD-GYP domain-containing protein (c-di-GMP phosphodiesterase class II)